MGLTIFQPMLSGWALWYKMENKNTTNKFEKAKHSLEEAQKEEKNRQHMLGRSIEEIDLTIKLWKDLSEQGRITPEIANSGEVLSDTLYRESYRFLGKIRDSEIGNNLRYIASLTETTSSMVVSGSAMVFAPQNLTDSYIQLRNFKEQKNNQEEIIDQLRSKELNNIATEYKNAWDLFFSSLEDKTRGAMALMRGAIDKLYYRFAPTEQVQGFLELRPNFITKIKKFLGLKIDKLITKRQRIQYIASELIQDEDKRKVFLDAENRFTKICNKLSSFKKHGILDEDRTKNFLYEADSLIKLFLISIS